MKNSEEIAHIFRSIAQMLEIKDENIFRIRAYYRAAEIVRSIDNVEEFVRTDTLTKINGIGNDLASKIKEYFSSGAVAYFEKLKNEIPAGVLELLTIPTMGPKTVKLFYQKLNIDSIDALEKNAKAGTLLQLEGIKEKTIQNILKGIEIVRKGKQCLDIVSAWEIAQYYINALKNMPEVKQVAVAGSVRRMKETVKDIDILILSSKPTGVMDKFCRLQRVKEVIAKGETKTAIRSQEGIQVDVRVVAPRSFGAALLYFTGSKSHNVKMRTIAIRKKLKINEYGIFRGRQCIASKTEQDIYRLLGMQLIAPELREDAGEIESALAHALPVLVDEKHIRGDLHVHSRYSDGSNSIAEIAQACQERGYGYVLITDHSQSLKIAGGLSVKELKRKKKEIDVVNGSLKNFTVLFGAEVEIDAEGNLDYDEAVLRKFDFVVAAIHSGFKQSKDRLTKRLIKASRHPYVDIIAHPTGRLRGVRDAYDVDFESFFKAAKENNTSLEINAFPDRLDLSDALIRSAKAKGLKFSIGTDAHQLAHLSYMKFGVGLARRGCLQAQDVLNAMSIKKLLTYRKKRP